MNIEKELELNYNGEKYNYKVFSNGTQYAVMLNTKYMPLVNINKKGFFNNVDITEDFLINYGKSKVVDMITGLIEFEKTINDYAINLEEAWNSYFSNRITPESCDSKKEFLKEQYKNKEISERDYKVQLEQLRKEKMNIGAKNHKLKQSLLKNYLSSNNNYYIQLINNFLYKIRKE